MRMVRSILLGTFLVAATSAYAASNKQDGPTNKAANASFSSVTSFQNPTSCQRVSVSGRVTVAGTVDDGGGVEQLYLQIFDDGVLVSSVPMFIAVGFQATFDFTMAYAGAVQNAVPGISVVVQNDPAGQGTTFAFVDLLPPVDNITCPGTGANLSLVSNTPVVQAAAIPALAPAALMLLSALLGFAAWRRRR
jgi:hypothetical protein